MHESLAIDDMDVGPAIQHCLHDLLAGHVLPLAPGEHGDDSPALLDVPPKDGVEPYASVVVGEAGDDVERSITGFLLPEPDPFEKRNQSLAVARRVDVRMDRELVHLLRRMTSVSVRTALLAW